MIFAIKYPSAPSALQARRNRTRTKGSHRQFKNPNKPGAVTVSGKPSLDIPRGTLNSILKHAGLKERRGDQL